MNENYFAIFQDAGGQGIGFMLGSLNVNWALTSEACLKGLSKTASGEVVTFRGIFMGMGLCELGCGKTCLSWVFNLV